MVAAGAPAEALAAPSAEACKYCEYRIACPPFFRDYDLSWGWYRIHVLGVVRSVETYGQQAAVILTAQAPTAKDIRARTWPMPLKPAVGSRIAVVDAAPTAQPDEIRMTWETRVAVWE
jgi:hypothetical protein